MPIRQFVYYLGEKPTRMKSKLDPQEVCTGFELRSLSGTGYQGFLSSDIPEEIMLALLADFGEETAEGVIEKILRKLMQLKGDQLALEKYLRQLLLLARLRQQLNETLQKQLETMALTYDIEKDSLYQKGMEKGMEKGIEKGLEKGMEKGMEKGKLEGQHLKALAFEEKCLKKGMSITETAELTELSIEQVQALADRIKK